MNVYLESLDQVTFADVEGFISLGLPEDERPKEGVTLDYKADIPKDFGERVAAFANTAGGVLILGVTENNNVPIGLDGIERRGGDLKTRIANIICSTVQPRPMFSVGVATLPSSPIRDVAVVRVDEGDFPPYIYTKDQTNRIPMRVADRTVAASLRDIENMFVTRGLASPNDPRRRHLPENGFYVRAKDDGGKETPSRTGLTMWVRPSRPLRLPLDGALERVVLAAWRSELAQYPRQPPGGEPTVVSARDADYFDVGPVGHGVEFRRMWRFCADASIGLCAEIKDPASERILLFDIVDDLCRCLLVARKLFSDLGARGRLLATFKLRLSDVQVVSLFRDRAIATPHGIAPVIEALPPFVSQVSERPFDRLIDDAELQEPAEIVADLINRQLRTLRGADLELTPFAETIARYCLRVR